MVSGTLSIRSAKRSGSPKAALQKGMDARIRVVEVNLRDRAVREQPQGRAGSSGIRLVVSASPKIA